MSASSTVKPHIHHAGTAAASAPAISHPRRCPIHGMDVEKYVQEAARSYDSISPAFLPPRFKRPTDRMRFEIVVPPSSPEADALPSLQAPPAPATLPALRSEPRRPARAVLDVF